MPLYFIEMGQGIIANGDLRVVTSPLYSCTLIAAYNGHSGDGGAFHYPAESLEDEPIAADMQEWIEALAPTEVRLVFAADTTGTGAMGTRQIDRQQLQEWVQQHCGFGPTTIEANGAGMELLAGGGMNAGRVVNLAGNFEAGNRIDVQHQQAGVHAGYRLFGVNRQG